jgi:hypothetical protein
MYITHKLRVCTLNICLTQSTRTLFPDDVILKICGLYSIIKTFSNIAVLAHGMLGIARSMGARPIARKRGFSAS